MDEIMCGSGRCGTYFAFEQEGVVPDITTLGKGLGGGFAPIAAMAINQKVVDTLKTGSSVFNHGHTYQAHPMTCAIALAVQKILKREQLIDRVITQGQLLLSSLQNELKDCEYVADIRGEGLFLCVEFMKDKPKKQNFPRDMKFGIKVQEKSFELGVPFYPGAGTVDGSNGDHVLLAPPYTVSDDEIKIIVNAVRRAYEEVVQTLLVAS